MQKISTNEAIELIRALNLRVFEKCSLFFEEKSLEDFNFLLRSTEENQSIIIKDNFKKADPSTDYFFEISRLDCEISFTNGGSGIFVELLNEFEDFDDYFSTDKDNGSWIARLLRNKFRENYKSELSSGDSDTLEQDFNILFIDNFVNQILNDVYYPD